tara:strand:+ start:487 stop:654 length:168 start_codon:yes stop_codon:yes gene_type:complete
MLSRLLNGIAAYSGKKLPPSTDGQHALIHLALTTGGPVVVVVVGGQHPFSNSATP